jgi:ParD-like antitoxin of type II ParDE toxin-antitoxin system
MAKAASPIRLQAELMQQAESTAKRFHRSTAEQIEYWADLGRAVSTVLDPDVLLAVASGLTKLKTESVVSTPIDPDTVFQSLEHDRKTGKLQRTVTSSTVRYQVSKKQPGYLERIDPDGNITTGQFENGQFVVLNKSDS